eukprot:m.61816 g.61816  ORF g.61816 m.61816 type:complete len:175 (-) comp11881_c0_seq5:207-731(-)
MTVCLHRWTHSFVCACASVFHSKKVETLYAVTSFCCVFLGVSQYGMLRQCDESIYNDQFVTRCRFPPRLSGTWAATAMCMIVGLCILAYATYKAASAVADHRALSKAKWAGFWCAVMWALAAVLFPVGLAGEPVGGEVFRLPENSSIGVAYILFVVSLLTLFMGEIIALRIVLN